MTTDLDENGIGKSTNPNVNQGGGGLAQNAISHEDMLSDSYNYMKWKNFRIYEYYHSIFLIFFLRFFIFKFKENFFIQLFYFLIFFNYIFFMF